MAGSLRNQGRLSLQLHLAPQRFKRLAVIPFVALIGGDLRCQRRTGCLRFDIPTRRLQGSGWRVVRFLAVLIDVSLAVVRQRVGSPALWQTVCLQWRRRFLWASNRKGHVDAVLPMIR